MRPIFLAAATVAVAAALAGCARATAVGSPDPAAAASSGAFIVRLGNDTVNVEQFTRTGSTLRGELLNRSPMTFITSYEVTLGADGMPVRMELRQRRADGSLLPNGAQSVTVLYQGDTVVTQIQRDTMIVRKVAARGVYPFINASFAMYELALANLRRAGRDSADVQMLGVGGARPSVLPMKLASASEGRVWYFGDPQMVTLDAQGRLTALDGTRSTSKYIVTRVNSVNLAALANQYAALDAAGRGLGMSSTRDTTRATIGAAQIWVDYGRPSMRGRDVWANGVLGDTLWRTGANAATQLNTSIDLVFNGVTVPAGRYSVFTSARNGVYQLVLNRQTGQWGTEYDRARDVVRVPMSVATLPQPVERFTIEVVPQGSGGAVRLLWGTRVLTAPFTIRQ